jgi:23S rRNA (cytosine1962-C5)-methyltransferase
MELYADIVAAWQRRAALHAEPDLDAYRVFHGFDEGCPGLAIDRYGDTLCIDCRPSLLDRLDVAVAALDGCGYAGRIVARPRRQKPFALRGDLSADPIIAREHGLRFAVSPARPGNPGLFLDARPARRWIREHSRERRVLNLFAFTGSLGVAAAAGGARRVVHLDNVPSALDACRDNHELNDLPVDDRDLARINVYQHLRRQSAGRQEFDAIIVDPPPLAGRAARTDRTPGGRGVAALAPLAARMLAPGGWMLCFFHHSERSRDDLEDQVRDASQTPLEVLWRGQSGPDFPEANPGKKLRITAFLRPLA